MNQSEKTEKRILQISLAASVAFVIVEFFMAIWIKSHTVLMDTAFDASELVIIAVSILLTPLLYKPVTEKRPFGYAQCESLFIVVKGFMLVAVTISLIINNIQVIISGGNHINASIVSLFELSLSALCFVVLLVLKHYGGHLDSPLIRAELYSWKVDVVYGIGVSVAFLIPLLLEASSFTWLLPYFDQIVAITLAILMLPTPIKMVITSSKDLLLFAPNEEALHNIKKIVEPICEEKNCEIEFIDLMQTGRKTWIDITLKSGQEYWRISELKDMHKKIMAGLNTQFGDVSLELIPSMDD